MARVPRVEDVVYSEDNDSPSGAGGPTKMIFSVGSSGPIILEVYYDNGDVVFWDDAGRDTVIDHIDQRWLRLLLQHLTLGDHVANHILIPHLRRLARRQNPY